MKLSDGRKIRGNVVFLKNASSNTKKWVAVFRLQKNKLRWQKSKNFATRDEAISWLIKYQQECLCPEFYEYSHMYGEGRTQLSNLLDALRRRSLNE